MSNVSVFSMFGTKDFDEIFSGIDVMLERNFFLDCDSYQILLPKKSNDTAELNIFEQTLLKLLAIRPMMTAKDLAELSCLEVDFVSAVIESLIGREYLTADNRPTNKAAGYSPHSNLEENTEKTGARLFALRGTDRLIPIVCWNENNIIQGELTNGTIRASWGSVGTEKSVFGQSRSYRSEVIRRPTGESALALLKNEQKRLKLNDTVLKKPTLENVGSVFLHLKAIVQRGNVSEVLISDGLWASNDDIVSYLKEVDGGFFTRIISQATSTQGFSNDIEQKISHSGKYKELKAILEKIGSVSGSLNKDDQDASRDNRLTSIKNLFDILEWTMYYYLQNNRPDEQILDTFFNQRTNENMRLAMTAAENINIFIGKNDEVLFSRCDGKILRKDFIDSQNIAPNLDRLFPLCIVEASRNPQSGWHKIIAKNNSLLSDIHTLREVAKKIRHADNIDDIDDSILERLHKIIEDITITLLPDFRDDGNKAQTKIISSSSERIANAIGSITPDKLTYMEFGKLPGGVRSELIKIAPSLDEKFMLDSSDFVLSLSKIMEIFLREKISSMQIAEHLDKNDAIKTLNSRLQNKIPDSLTYVGDWYYTQALTGKNSTLGAYILVWCGHLEQEKFDSINIGEVLDFISELTKLRSHGNSIGLMISAEKLKNMREQLFKIIKQLEAY